MNRLVLTTIGVAGLTLGVPGAALAGHHHKAAGHHKSTVHHVRHAEHLGPPAGAPVMTGAPSSSTTPSGTTPTPPAQAHDANAGTVASFTNGVLAVKLADGTLVTGTVAATTKIECAEAVGHAARHGAGSDDPTEPGATPPAPVTTPAPMSGQDDMGKGNDMDGDDDAAAAPGQPAAPACDKTALVVGAVVHEADLLNGAFTKIELA